MDGARLRALTRRLAGRGTIAFLTVRGDRLVQEWYRLSRRDLLEPPAEHRFQTASMAKAAVGSTALLLALGDGLLRLDDPVARFVPSWAEHPLKSRITVGQLATHSSGLDGQRSGSTKDWEHAFRRDFASRARLALEVVPVRFEPGRTLWYSNPAFAVLGYVLAVVLRGTPTPDVPALLRRRIMQPLGLPEAAWSLSYGQDFEAHGVRVHEVAGGAYFTPRALARLGRLILAGGVWEGRRLLDPATVAAALRPADVPLPPDWRERRQPIPALGWWSNAHGAWGAAPADTLIGAGAGHELLVVIPSLDLVAIRFGAKLGSDHTPQGDYWIALEDQLLAPLVAAVRS
jgi:CubicO group peptidase (beta-lactamase class C family)